MEQKRPADIFQELLDYLWNGLAGGKGLEAAEKRRLQKENEKRADLSDMV